MEINIKKFIIRIDESVERDRAKLVGIGEDGNEYTLSPKVYVHGEYHKVQIDIIGHELNSSIPHKT